MELTCYVMDGWNPRIRPASNQREWMEASPERFAYRCLPLAIANSSGWEVLSPCGFAARWNGGPLASDVEVRLDPGVDPRNAPVALFGQGTITFHVEGLFRTPPGWNLWVSGSPNAAKDGIAPLGGIIETDWSPYSFTMNWRFTRPDVWIRFEENEPFCFFFPVQRQLIEGIKPEIRPLDEVPELKAEFLAWSASRDAFHKWVAEAKPTAPADKWQKLYYRGLRPDGSPGAEDHVSKVRARPFGCPVTSGLGGMAEPVSKPMRGAPAMALAAETDALELESVDLESQADIGSSSEGSTIDALPAVSLAPSTSSMTQESGPLRQEDLRGGAGMPDNGPGAPVHQSDAASALWAVPKDSARDLARREWTLSVAQRQRLLSPRYQAIPRVPPMSSEQFLDEYYAPANPVVIEGAISNWPALTRWTPDYLKRTVGSAEVEFQGGRNAASDYELAKDRHKQTMPFDAFIDLISSDGAGNDAYITAYNTSKNERALEALHADLGHIKPYLTDGQGMLWIGPAGTFTPLHFDLTNNLLAQVVGSKVLTMLPPSEAAKLENHRHVFSAIHDITDPERLELFPSAKDAVQYDVELNQGDLLFIPVGWWHQVAAVDFSVMLTYTNFVWPNDPYATFPTD